MNNLGGWLVGMSELLATLTEDPYLKDDPARREKAFALIVVWLAIAVAAFLVVLIGGVLLVDLVHPDPDAGDVARFIVFAVSFMLIFIVWLYGPRLTLALARRRAKRDEERRDPR